ncbi:hypothetical protein JF550_04405 [Microbacterium esteraromaticum]|uniref:Uncharacterized protein n=1 Tax=Microbacterium esteraromaticum TaxID=57043 RepID=A0A939IUM6_9MICO|nr:hypothetical protein [Microbacterium esteraromaticum]MBN8205194.1 hypothetical protein [Microbacterium esteraromaticum]MBN8415348.1 hypothetical protein [Microbacterium esteraromaticum]MBN8424303.1 hypothetical protein [Microbacterium esteraromaticum]
MARMEWMWVAGGGLLVFGAAVWSTGALMARSRRRRIGRGAAEATRGD